MNLCLWSTKIEEYYNLSDYVRKTKHVADQ